MSTPIQSIVQNADGSWTFSWYYDTSQTYQRVVLWGVELAQVTAGSYTWNGQGYPKFPPPLEIVGAQEQALSEQFLPYLIIQWYGEVVSSYLVQQFVSGSWQTIDTIQDTGLWIYTKITPILVDETSYSYRVVAVDSVGNQSTPRQYNRYVVTPPKPPDGTVAVGYSGGNITIVSA